MSLAIEKHIKYCLDLDKTKDLEAIGFFLREHLKLAGGYWCITAIATMGQELPAEKKQELIKLYVSCQNSDGGFGGNLGHDSHLTSSHYAVLVLGQWGALDQINKPALIGYVKGLQKEDGSFMGDMYGEVDTRFSYCGLSSLKILEAMDQVDVEKAVEFILKCRNFDGGFGGMPLMESHAAYVFCCVGALAVAGALHKVDKNALALWLSRRQTDFGGFNGRPEKLPDVCYSWWVLSSMAMIKRMQLIDLEALETYIFRCQDGQKGGIGDRPGNEVDVFHTFFGVASLSLINPEKHRVKVVDPIFAIPRDSILQNLPHLTKLIN